MRNLLAVGLAALMLFNSVPSARACGPSVTEPVYVSKQSPDLPFQEYANGKIGIVRPGFGRKTLFIAYRYLNGGSFTSEEQTELVAVLKGTAPEDEGLQAVKAWMDARKEFIKEEQTPEIYTERKYGGYNFFPNCTKNAFEVALQTLKDRAASYGAEDRNVRAWLEAQDAVFENCGGGLQIPNELGAESVTWLRKDRDYQIAAAHFYSLNFDEARARFEKISADADSPWQEIAGYLVARTLIRQASLAADETRKREVYAQAEKRLQTLVMNGGKYAGASKKLLGLVKYQTHPDQRVVELGRTLAAGSDDDNLRQDLIDYVWLLDKFESQILQAEEDRKKEPEPTPETSGPLQTPAVKKLESGELIEITMFQRSADGNRVVSSVDITIKFDASQAEVLSAFEQKLGRKLTDEETKEIKETHRFELSERKWRLSPARKWDNGGLSEHEGCNDYGCTRLTFDLIPDFLRSDDLSDWMLTLQTESPGAYTRALSKWRETGSPAWMLTALMKAEKSSSGLARLMQAAEKITRDEPGFATAAYHLVRLKTAMGQTDDARRRLDDIISWQSGVLPVSAQNQFLEQRTQLARGLNEFLKSAQRKPVAFYDYGMYGKLTDMLRIEKGFFNENMQQSKEEYERKLDERYKDLLPWDERFGFDEATLEILNWHFPLPLLAEAARNPNVPDYLQRSLVLAVWTRAILLNNDELALKIAPEVVKVQPQMASVFRRYLKARTPRQRRTEALYVLLKFPNLSPFVQGGLPSFSTSEELEYYFGESWWCPPSDIDYNEKGEEIPKVVPKPGFLTAAQLEAAQREHVALVALGDGKSYLGKQVLEWARTSPSDERIPEALFIAAQANLSYKYGCDSWTFDEKTKRRVETLLRQRYPHSPWTAKLAEAEN